MVSEMTVVHIFIRCFFSLNQLELEARPMLNHFPVSCTQSLLSHRLHTDPISPFGHQPATAQATSLSHAGPTARWDPGILVPTELLQLLVSTKPLP